MNTFRLYLDKWDSNNAAHNLNLKIMNIDYNYLITFLSDDVNIEDLLNYYFFDDIKDLSKEERDEIQDAITTAANNVAALIEYNKYKRNL